MVKMSLESYPLFFKCDLYQGENERVKVKLIVELYRSCQVLLAQGMAENILLDKTTHMDSFS